MDKQDQAQESGEEVGSNGGGNTAERTGYNALAGGIGDSTDFSDNQ